jgi:hypothetical protein
MSQDGPSHLNHLESLVGAMSQVSSQVDYALSGLSIFKKSWSKI